MIHQVLMGCGDFSVRLRPDTPDVVIDAIGSGDLLVVTPTRLADATDRATVLGQARYTGRLDTFTGDRLAMSGQSVLCYLGDGDNPSRGSFLVGSPITGPKTFSQFVTAAFAAGNRKGGLSLGSAFSSPATVINGDQIADTEATRDAFNRFCKIVGAEYRVNADGTFDWGAPGVLWKSGVNIDTLLMTTCDGDDVDINALRVTRWSVTHEMADAIGAVYVRGSGGAVSLNGYYYFVDFSGAGFWAPSKVVTASTSDAGECSAIGAAVLAEAHTGHFQIQATVDCDDVGQYFTGGQPGDWVSLYDERNRLKDVANSGVYKGRTILPLNTHRVIEWTVPLRRQGVYVIQMAGNSSVPQFTNSVLDLSEFFEAETTDPTLVLSTSNPMTLTDAVTGARY